jgi:hypothetical protein
MSCTNKVGFGIGNAANQKYEAQKHILRHQDIVHHTEPSRETSRWREPTPDYHFKKNEGVEIRAKRKIIQENVHLSERMNITVNEQRYSRTHEYAPGWRIGIGASVENHNIKYISWLTNHFETYRWHSD